MNYFRNLKLWYLGFGWFGQLTFRAGWSADSWRKVNRRPVNGVTVPQPHSDLGATFI